MAINNIPNIGELLTEYQVCQEAANGQNASQWTFAGIFLGLSGAALGFIVPHIFEPHGTAFDLFIVLISIGILGIIWSVYGVWFSLNARSEICYRRMQQIEDQTHMVIQHEQAQIIGIRVRVFYTAINIIFTLMWILVIVFSLIQESV